MKSIYASIQRWRDGGRETGTRRTPPATNKPLVRRFPRRPLARGKRRTWRGILWPANCHRMSPGKVLQPVLFPEPSGPVPLVARSLIVGVAFCHLWGVWRVPDHPWENCSRLLPRRPHQLFIMLLPVRPLRKINQRHPGEGGLTAGGRISPE